MIPIRLLPIPTHDPQSGELNPFYEELTGKKNPLKSETMNATTAREIAIEVKKSGFLDIMDKIKHQARDGKFGLSITDHTMMNDQVKMLLKELDYSVKWVGTQRDDGYWQIEW